MEGAIADAADLKDIVARKELGKTKLSVGSGDCCKAGFKKGELNLGQWLAALRVDDDTADVARKRRSGHTE